MNKSVFLLLLALDLGASLACGGTDAQPGPPGASAPPTPGTYAGTFTSTTPSVAKSAPSPASIVVSRDGEDRQQLSWSAAGFACNLHASGGGIVSGQSCTLSLGASSAEITTTGGSVSLDSATLNVVVRWRVASTTGNVAGVKVGDATSFDFRGDR